MTVTVTGTTLTGCTIGPYYDPSIIYAQFAYPVPIVDGNLTIITVNQPNANTVPLVDGNLTVITINTPNTTTPTIVDGNLSINTVNAPNAFGPVFIGV